MNRVPKGMLLAAIAILLAGEGAYAQYSAVAGPFNGAGHGFQEQIGVGFGGNVGGGPFFNNGAAGGAHIGGQVGPLRWGLNAASGSDSSIGSVAPSVTVGNGGTGAIFSGSIRPFVTGLVPVVGDWNPEAAYPRLPAYRTSPLVERLVRMQDESAQSAVRPRPAAAPTAAPAPPPPRIASTAERGDLSLAEIRALQAEEGDPVAEEIAAYLEAARLREEAGDIGQALIDYGRAASRARGPQRDQIRQKMQQLRQQRGK